MRSDMYKLFLILTLLTYNNPWGYGQKKIAKKYFEAGRYPEASEAFQRVKKLEKKVDLLVLRGITHYYTNNLDACISDMSLANSKNSEDNRRLKYAGLSFMSKYDYKEAAYLFKLYLKTLTPQDKDYGWTANQIKRCGHALGYKYKEPLAFVENLNTPVNSVQDELKPIFSPTYFNKLYFSSNRQEATGGLRNFKGLSDNIKGRYYLDMFQVDLLNGQYEEPQIFLPLLNSPKHEILQSINSEGQIAYYIKSEDFHYGILYSDTFELNKVKNTQTKRVDLPFYSEKGDKDLTWVNDSLFLFSSKMLGGYGGYDIYFCQRINNVWQTPQNIGSEINTIDNEISPYLVNSGDILFFSSDKTQTLGGFDIFKSIFEGNQWSAPSSLNYPINSSRNDINLVLSPDGSFGLFSSNRADAIGGYDIYIAYFNEPVYEQLEKVSQPEFISYLSKNQEGYENKQIFEDEDNKASRIPREFISKSLLFRDNETVLSPNNKIIIKTLANIMTLYPETEVVLVSHTIPKSNNYSDMYFSIKRADIVIEELKGLKIAKDRIYSIGCGSDFPFSLVQDSDGKQTDRLINNRIEIRLINESYPNLNVVYDFEMNNIEAAPSNWLKLHRGLTGLFYKIEIAESHFAMNYTVIADDPSWITIEKYDNEPFKYYYGLFEDLKSVEKSGVKGNIIPFYKGKRISTEEIDQWLDKFPELIIFKKE